jgi:hypothetical protein
MGEGIGEFWSTFSPARWSSECAPAALVTAAIASGVADALAAATCWRGGNPSEQGQVVFGLGLGEDPILLCGCVLQREPYVFLILFQSFHQGLFCSEIMLAINL